MKKINKKNITLMVGLTILGLILGVVALANKNIKKSEIEEIGCKRTGCSGQLCIDSNLEELVTTCEWQDIYECYQKAECKRQNDGKCGFTKDEEFEKCVDQLNPGIEKIKGL